MQQKDFQIEFITPCFCAGADQTKAEIRASSIRGQLRWWFRALGGSRDDEAGVFGSTSGDEGNSSPLVVRVSEFKRGTTWQPFSMKMGTPGAYLWYYASVSSEKKRWYNQPPQKNGITPIVNELGHIPPGSTFTLSILWRRAIPEKLMTQFQFALCAFLHVGSIGLRASRGMGAFLCAEYQFSQEFNEGLIREIQKQGFEIKPRKKVWNKWEEAVFDAESWLKGVLRRENSAGKNGGNQTPLGSSSPRQTSAIYLRPLKLSTGKYSLLLFEAPHLRVLNKESRRSTPVLRNLNLDNDPPEYTNYAKRRFGR